MPGVDDIILRVLPYEVSRFPYWADAGNYRLIVDGEEMVGTDEVDWCSLPDILYDEQGRGFLGLSFPVHLGDEEFAQNMVHRTRDKRAVYIPVSGTNVPSRYIGFGKCSRLELYCAAPQSSVACQFASLFHGCWICGSRNPVPGKTLEPFGYWLSMVGDVIETHGLALPKGWDCSMVEET